MNNNIMSRFIRLTHTVLNTNAIHKIIIEPTKYYIITKKMDGFSWRFAGSGMGSISSNDRCEITVCEKEHPNDYKIISDWISKLE